MKRKGIMKWLTAFAMLALVVCLLPVTADAITVKGDYGITFSAGTLYCRTCNVAAMNCTDLKISQFSLSGNKLSVTYTFTLHYTHTYTVTEVYEPFYCMTSYSEQDVGVLGPLKFSREAGHFSDNWTSNGDGTHTGTCAICGEEETAACSGDSNANCSTEGTCSKCGGKYTPADDHAYKWESDGTGHWQQCANNPGHKKDEGTCEVGSTGKAATCTSKAECGTCGKPFGNVKATAHAWGDWTYGTVGENHTRTCALDPSHTETGKHDFTYALKPGDASHLYGTCGTCNYTMEAWVEYNNYPKNYSGNPIEALSIRYSDNWVGEKVADSAIVYKDNVKAGEATGTVTIAGVQLTAKFEIVPTTLTVTAISAQSRAYDGTDKVTVTEVTFAGKIADDDVGIKFNAASVANAKVGAYNEIVYNETDLELTGADKNNYQIISPSVLIPVTEPVVISPKEITATITVKDSIYGKVTAPVIILSGLLEADQSCAEVTYEGTTEKVVDGEKVKYQSADAPAEAGAYTVTVKVNSDNYKLTGTTSADFRIAKAPADYDAPKAIKLFYNGKDQELITAGAIRGNKNSFQYKKEADKTWGATIPAAKNAGKDVILWQYEEDENHLGASGKVEVEIEPAILTIVPDKDQKSTYGRSRTAVKYTVKGAISPEVPAFTGELAVYGKDAGTYEIKLGTLKLKDKDTFKAANYEIKLEKEKYIINPAYVVLTAEDQTIVCGKTINSKNYTITDLVGDDVAAVTLTPSTTDVTYGGTIAPSAVVKNDEGKDVTRNYYIAAIDGKLIVEPDFAVIEDITTENVNHGARDDIEALQKSLNSADTEKATGEQKKQIEDAKTACTELLAKIDASVDAMETDAIRNTAGISAENVKIDDEAAAQQAIKDIEKAKSDFAGNYSEEDLKKLDDQTAQLKSALDVIAHAKNVIGLLAALPEGIKAEDDAAAEVRAALKTLTDYEKELVLASGSGKLVDAVSYKILSGNGSTWEGDKSLSFTVDGDYERFVGIKVDGKAVNEKFYSAEEGSTVVTLKKAYLRKLSAQTNHTAQFLFDDGEADCIFYVSEDAVGGVGFIGVLIWLIVLAAAAGAAYLYIRKKKNG